MDKKNICLSYPTGYGKSKHALDIIKNNKYERVLIFVPKIVNIKTWQDEMFKWGVSLQDKKIICYASVETIKNLDYYECIIMDECHNITDRVFKHIHGYSKQIVGLTATYPRVTSFDTKRAQLDYLFQGNVLSKNTEDAINEGRVNEFEIILIPLTPNEQWKRMLGLLERTAYTQQDIFKRNRFIYDSRQKIEYIKGLVNVSIKQGKIDRTIIFTGNISHADFIGNSYHSENKKLKNYEKFNNGEIPYLTVVKTIDEGVNIKDARKAIISQCYNNSRVLIQRIGRVIRKEEGKVSNVIVVYLEDTTDERWTMESIRDISKERIKVYSNKELLSYQDYFTNKISII